VTVARAACATLGVAMLAGGLVAADGLSLRLIDPASGDEVVLEPGGRALHLVFFATWCPPCVAELDRLVELNARWEGRGYRLVIIGVNRRQTAERLKRFASGRALPGRLLFDASGSAGGSLGADELPAHFIFDSGGNEVLRSTALDTGVEGAIERLIGSGRRRGADR